MCIGLFNNKKTMNTKLAVVAFALILCFVNFSGCLGAPRPTEAELLEKSIAEYLRHDKELVKELQQLVKTPSDRVKRQSEFEVDVGNDPNLSGGEAENKPGFFDRAAKFVVELLQRFLRWINSDSN